MNILILNGSPAGSASITLQTMEYIKVLNPDHEYEVLHVGQQIRRFEKDFSEAYAALERAELIVFCYPVYTFLAPAQLHRFIGLMKASGIDFAEKFATQLTTSKHFYDTTAHRYISDNCADMRLRCIRGLSADMEDLLTKKGQKEARAFFKYVLWNIRKGYCEPASAAMPKERFAPVIATAAAVKKRGPEEAGSEQTACVKHRDALHIALVTDYDPDYQTAKEGVEATGDSAALADSTALVAMIDRFRSSFPGECELINLHEFPFSGGCLGCFHCASDGKCIYKDGFDDYLREHINGADAVVYAFTIRDHSMGHRFKMYDDRQFCNGHRTVTMGKPVGYLVDGDLQAEENLRTLIEARAEVGGNFLTGIASDEKDPDREIDQLAHRLAYAIRRGYTPPKNFYGVGGLKIFRDLIYEMQGLMREDHRFYKEHGFYDFPQKKRGKIAAMYLVGALMGNEKLMKKSKVSMTDGMLMPYKKVIEEAGNK